MLIAKITGILLAIIFLLLGVYIQSFVPYHIIDIIFIGCISIFYLLGV